jgi:hypothetical protein
VCVGESGPQKEICDGKDNDCDGKVDQAAECPGQSACVEGQCLLPCAGSEFSCPGGSRCVNGYCVPDKCAKAACKPSERCVDGKCVAKCAAVSCTEHEKCEPTSGKCVDDSCYTKGCAPGDRCVGYACVEDPCPAGACPVDQMCVDGKCYDTCLNVSCPKGQLCSRGRCALSPCEGFPPCESNFACKVVEGKPRCEPDPCRIVSCPRGQVCFEGACVGDQCSAARCPDGLRCEVSSLGEADCRPIAGQALPTTKRLLASGGGGCACSVGARLAGEEALGVALLLVVLAFLRRRRAP